MDIQPIDALYIIACIGICQAAGVIGALSTRSDTRAKYLSYKKPRWHPPPSAFGPVWLTLYTLMGLSLWFAARSGFDSLLVVAGTLVFTLQLSLNSVWSYFFFGKDSKGVALAIILALWVVILANIALFYLIDLVAALLLVPYIAWVSAASYLNYYIWKNNPRAG